MPTDTSHMRLFATKTSARAKQPKSWKVWDDSGRAFIQRFEGDAITEWHSERTPMEWTTFCNGGFTLVGEKN